MSDHMHYNQSFAMEEFVDHAMIANSQFVHTFKLSNERLKIRLSYILLQPLQPIDNSTDKGSFQFCEILRCCLQKTHMIHVLNRSSTV